MLEKKGFSKLVSMFSFVAASVDRRMSEEYRHLITHARSNFSELRHLLNCKTLEHVLALQSFNTIQHRIQNLKVCLKDTSDAYGLTGLCNLKFHLLHYFTEDLDPFGYL